MLIQKKTFKKNNQKTYLDCKQMLIAMCVDSLNKKDRCFVAICVDL